MKKLWLWLRRGLAMALFAVAFVCEGLAEMIYQNPFDN